MATSPECMNAELRFGPAESSKWPVQEIPIELSRFPKEKEEATPLSPEMRQLALQCIGHVAVQASSPLYDSSRSSQVESSLLDSNSGLSSKSTSATSPSTSRGGKLPSSRPQTFSNGPIDSPIPSTPANVPNNLPNHFKRHGEGFGPRRNCDQGQRSIQAPARTATEPLKTSSGLRNTLARRLNFVQELLKTRAFRFADILLEQAVNARDSIEVEIVKRQKVVECTACFSEVEFKRTAVLSCKHQYCATCLEHLVRIGCESEMNWPPKCCRRPVKERLVRKFVTEGTLKMYEEKRRHFIIPMQFRWYCPQPDCAKPMDIRKTRKSYQGAHCTHCDRAICVTCREQYHRSGEQCKSEVFVLTLQEAERMKWRRCFMCKQMVELSGGCRHVLCSCGAQFCYACGEKWPGCKDEAGCVNEHSTRRVVQIRRQLARAPARRLPIRRSRPSRTHRRLNEGRIRQEADEEAETARAITQVIEFQREEERMQRMYRQRDIQQQFQTYRQELVELRRYQKAEILRRHEREARRPSSSSAPDPAANHLVELLLFHAVQQKRQEMLDRDEDIHRSNDLPMDQYRPLARTQPSEDWTLEQQLGLASMPWL